MITSKTPAFQSFNIYGVDHIAPGNALEELQNGNAIILDVREESEHMIEYLPMNDVFHFPMSSIMDNLHKIPKDKPLISLCQRGVRSTKVANMLNRNGFIIAVNLDGGFIAWKSKGLPYETILPDACNGCKGSCSCSQ